MINNPFLITSEYVSPEYFCDRESETGVLIDNILNGRNTLLISPRRMGKSGLISHVFSQSAVADAYMTFSVDLYSTSSLPEMILLLSNEIVRHLQSRGQRIQDMFLSVVKSLGAGLKMNPASGELTFDISLGDIEQPSKSLEEIFRYLESSDVPCIVAIDEFQQIADYPEKNVMALLRGHVQKCRQTGFIFSGSKRRMLEKLFDSPSEPFYQSAVKLYLDPIDRDKYYLFSDNHFQSFGKKLDRDCFDAVYDMFEGHTWYVQRMLNQIFSVVEKGETAAIGMIDGVLDYIIKSESRSFEEQFSMISGSQKQLLMAIAKEGRSKGITSVSFVRKHSLKSPSTVQSAARALYENETITRTGEYYSITNRFLSLWIRRHYGL